jgi:DeoR family fructose operon transcriptional repressor
MNFQKRKNTILQLLEEKGEVSVRQLADLLATSEITVRRDLVSLTADGLVYRTHGGVMKVDLVKRPIDFAHKVARNIDQKDHICRLAATEIQENDIIFMDCGSTVFRLCHLIRNKSIRVITNSLPVVYELAGSRAQVNLVGGEVDQERLAIHGSIAVEHIGRYKADKAFVGVDGVSAAKGLTAHSENEASITLAMSANAGQTYLLCDSSKIGKDSYFQFASLDKIQVLITDKQDDESLLIAAAGVKVIC